MDNDLRWLQEDFDIVCRRVLDTQDFCRCLGLQYTALPDLWAAMCNMHASKEVKRRLQRSDWRHRPLARLQQLYAASDAYFLLRIAGILLMIAAHGLPDQLKLNWYDTTGLLQPPPCQFLLRGHQEVVVEWQSVSMLANNSHIRADVDLWADLERGAEKALQNAKTANHDLANHCSVGSA
eukprot:5266031-Amphidinium_carterae.1